MGKSRRNNPHHSITTSVSEKQEKRLYNRKLRRVSKQVLNTHYDDEDLLMPVLQEHSDPYWMSKDGKVYFDENEYPKLMRK